MGFGILYDGPPLRGVKFDIRLSDPYGDAITTLKNHECRDVRSGFFEAFSVVNELSKKNNLQAVAMSEATPTITSIRVASGD